MNAMTERQKARENSILAHCIKTQIKPAVASFEDDNVTRVLNTYLSSSSCTEGVEKRYANQGLAHQYCREGSVRFIQRRLLMHECTVWVLRTV